MTDAKKPYSGGERRSGTLTPEQISGIRLAEIEFKKWMGLAILPCTFHQLLYKLIPQYRLWAEVEALYYPDDRRPLFAEYMTTPTPQNTSY